MWNVLNSSGEKALNGKEKRNHLIVLYGVSNSNNFFLFKN